MINKPGTIVTNTFAIQNRIYFLTLYGSFVKDKSKPNQNITEQTLTNPNKCVYNVLAHFVWTLQLETKLQS